jgi:hypothetical protein
MPEASLQSWLERERFGKGLNVQISFQEKPLLVCKGYSENFTIEIKDKDEKPDGKKSLVMSALTMSGFLNQQFSYSGGTHDNPMELKDTVDMARFKEWLPGFVKGKVLVPDTNTIMNCLLSGLKFMMGLDFLKSLKIQIPRLVVLELERKANPQPNKGEKGLLAKREAMLAYQELIYLKNTGATFLPKLDKDTFDGFAHFAGEQLTDSWIRREIHEAIEKKLNRGKPEHMVFLTSDLTSALSGIAEGLDTNYVSKINTEEKLLRGGDISQVARLIVTIASLYGEISVSINSNHFLFKGMWTGKTTIDWIDYVVLYMPKGA